MWPRKRVEPKAEPASVGRRQHGVPKSDRNGTLTSAGWRLLRHNGESRETDRPTWSHHRRFSGGQGACREVGSERLEENHRVAINGSNPNLMNRSAKDGARSSPHYGGEGIGVPLRRTKVC